MLVSPLCDDIISCNFTDGRSRVLSLGIHKYFLKILNLTKLLALQKQLKFSPSVPNVIFTILGVKGPGNKWILYLPKWFCAPRLYHFNFWYCYKVIYRLVWTTRKHNTRQGQNKALKVRQEKIWVARSILHFRYTIITYSLEVYNVINNTKPQIIPFLPQVLNSWKIIFPWNDTIGNN